MDGDFPIGEAGEMPHAPDDALDAEAACIACVFCDVNGKHRALDRMAALVTAEDFADPRHAAVWGVILAAHARGEDVVTATVGEGLVALHESKALKHLSALAALSVDPAHWKLYADKVAERAYQRATAARVAEALEALKGAGQPVEVVDAARDILAKIPAGVRGRRDDSLEAGGREFLKEADEAMRAARQGVNLAARWGLPALDGGAVNGYWCEGAIGGLFPGELYVVGGTPAAGKTCLVWMSAIATARGDELRAGRPVLVFSLEMTNKQLNRRLASQMTGIPVSRIKRGAFTDDEHKALKAAVRELAALPIKVVSDCRTLESIRARTLAEGAEAESEDEKPALVVVDYLQLVEMERAYRDDNRADAARAQGLHVLAVDAKVPVLAVSSMTKSAQLRATEKGEVDSTGAAGSGLAYAADVIAFLVRTDPKDPSPWPEVLFVMTKARDDEPRTIPLRFVKARGQFKTSESMSTDSAQDMPEDFTNDDR